ncbi:hypothetical protein BC940DRAFT_365906 [Gongronella butleri]|nr:hypothetical protein BC940DRAFT_365906 [Gongronella butleri]
MNFNDDDWVITSTTTSQQRPMSFRTNSLKSDTHVGDKAASRMSRPGKPSSKPSSTRNGTRSTTSSSASRTSGAQGSVTTFSRPSRLAKPVAEMDRAPPSVPAVAAARTPSPATTTASYRNNKANNVKRPAIADAPQSPLRPLEFTEDPALYVSQLITTYHNTAGLLRYKEEAESMFVTQHLVDNLEKTEDPVAWVQALLMQIGMQFHVAKHSTDMNPKFQRLLVQSICRGLVEFLQIHDATEPVDDEQEEEEVDLISFAMDDDDEKGHQDEKHKDDAAPQEIDLIDLTDDEPGALGLPGMSNNAANSTPTTPLSATHDVVDDLLGDMQLWKPTTASTKSHPIGSTSPNSAHGSKYTTMTVPALSPQPPITTVTNHFNNNSSFSLLDDEFVPITAPASSSSPSPKVMPHATTKNKKPLLTHAHQIAFIGMIRSLPTPSIIYYALDVFRVAPLLSKDGEFEDQGTLLCQQLLYHGFFNESVSCIQRFNLYANFPLGTFAEYLFNANMGSLLLVYVKDKVAMQHGLVAYINAQLRFNFAGNLGVVDQALLDNDTHPDLRPMARMRDRRYQKELVQCGTKILKEQLGLPVSKYYFIWLSQKYASLRWVISSRSAQQCTEADYSIDASSNFNGLLELVVNETPALARLAIKELVDIRDATGAAYFAQVFGENEFLQMYQSLSARQRLLGVVKGEQISHAGYSKQRKTVHNDPSMPTYRMPASVTWTMVNDKTSLAIMAQTLQHAQFVGLDTEWVPTMAASDESPVTALMQIATQHQVFLLDLKTLLHPSAAELLLVAEMTLREMFEATDIVKLAYEFGGDLMLMAETMPSVKRWHIANFKDLKKVRHFQHNRLGDVVQGGLAGVVATFQGAIMNKKQQISNWEKRPLTDAQVEYAACDAYCLLDVYQHLMEINHPFVHDYTTFSSPFVEKSPAYVSGPAPMATAAAPAAPAMPVAPAILPRMPTADDLLL